MEFKIHCINLTFGPKGNLTWFCWILQVQTFCEQSCEIFVNLKFGGHVAEMITNVLNDLKKKLAQYFIFKSFTFVE